MKKYCVNSLSRTGSTLVVNIVSELINPGNPIYMPHDPKITLNNYIKQNPDIDVFKLHDINQIDRHRHINFIVPIRPGLKPTKNDNHNGVIKEKYHNFNNVLILYYNDLLYKSIYNPDSVLSEEDVVQSISLKMEEKFNIEISNENKILAVQRVKNLDKKYKEIKNLPFGTWDKYYHIHGSHRGRSTEVDK